MDTALPREHRLNSCLPFGRLPMKQARLWTLPGAGVHVVHAQCPVYLFGQGTSFQTFSRDVLDPGHHGWLATFTL